MFAKAKSAVHVCNIRTVCYVNYVSGNECHLRSNISWRFFLVNVIWQYKIFKFEGENVLINKIIGFNFAFYINDKDKKLYIFVLNIL